jgi:phosphate transport system protein
MPQKQFSEKLDDLTQRLLTMSHEVEEMVDSAVRLAIRKNGKSPGEIDAIDEEIDREEVAIEETAIELLALHQPMATDLRIIVTILKINTDLERIGDHGVNIAHAVRRLREAGEVPPIPPELEEMSRLARGMLQDALDAFLQRNADQAREVLARDDRVDGLQESSIRVMLTHMLKEDISACLQVILISRNIERIADLATNIAEDVVYMVRGQTIRHGRGEDEASASEEPEDPGS